MSSSSPERIVFGLPRRQALVLALLAAAALAAYLAYSYSIGGAGFPLDDAWIHQVYARNLVQRAEWAFNPGQPSAGATSPVWVALLALGHRWELAPYTWTFFLGWLFLFSLSLVGSAAFRALSAQWERYSAWAGALLILEFHSVWSAASGMETILFTMLCVAVFAIVLSSNKTGGQTAYWFNAGLLVALSVAVRPEGVTLLAPLAVAALLIPSPGEKIRTMRALLVGFLLLILPYLFFNFAISGSLLPNTFYAKQAEYASVLAQPLFLRVAQLALQLFVGPGAPLIPGFFYFIYKAVRERSWRLLGWLAWGAGFLLLFSLRLAVTYQHGRYIMPLIPIYILLSLSGMARWIEPNAAVFQRRVLSKAWVAAVAVGGLAFYGLGASAYSSDVAFINTEMVAAAAWVDENTPPDALIAAHDIGALGYFAQRQIIDLAGLTSPEVIPFIRDESRLAVYLDEQGADYLVTFPGWYPYLSSQAQLLFQTSAEVSQALGGENMAVYSWPH